MIPTPPGWIRLVRGEQVHLRAPRERPIGELWYRERYGPLRTARQITAERLAVPMPTFELEGVSEPERMTTHEGEHAAFVQITGRLSKHPTRRLLGIVFGDHATSLLDGMTIAPQHFDEFEATFRDLVHHITLILGRRRRRFVYKRPAGWLALANVLITHYMPPDFPQNNARITVYPALPREQKGRHLVDIVMAEERSRGAKIVDAGTQEETASDHGLAGTHRRIISQPSSGPALAHRVVVFEDKHYTYPLRVHVPADEEAGDNEAQFDALCASVEPFQSAAPVEEVAADPFDFWAQ